MSRRTVGLVVPAFDTGGGVPTVAMFLRRVLLDSGRYQVRVISISSDSRDPLSVHLSRPGDWMRRPRVERRTGRGVEYFAVGARFGEIEFHRYRARPELDRLLDGCDLVQVVAGAPAWGWPVLHARRPAGRPVLLQVASLARVERKTHGRVGSAPLRAWRALMTLVTTRIEDAALRAADAVQVENRRMLEHVRRRAPRQRVRFAHPGVDADFFRPGPWAGDGYILAVGRFADPRKDVRLLLDAYDRLCASRAAVPALVLAGQMPAPADRAYLERLKVRDRVRLAVDVSNDELARLYREARLFVLSSREEGLGMVLLEAMASGLPVVSTDCGGPSTVVDPGETGLLTPVGDADALARAMAAVLDDHAAARSMGRAGRARVEREFTLQAAGERYLELYDELLGTGARSRPAGDALARHSPTGR